MASSTTIGHLLPTRTLSEFVLDALRSLWKHEPDEAIDASMALASQTLKADPVVGQIRRLVEPAMEAQNVPQLRQALARVALSPAMASLELELGAFSEVGPEDLRDLPVAFPHATLRLGATAADLFAEAVRLLHPVLVAMGAGSQTTSFENIRQLGAEETARLRHQIILGDVLPPDVAEVALTNGRGQVAFLALLAASLGDKRVPEWKAVALGESAVEGMKALQRLALPSEGRIDLEAAAREHAAWKDDLFTRLELQELADVVEERKGAPEKSKEDAP